MKAPRFAKLFAQLPLLNQPQRLQVLDALHPAAGLDRIISLIGEIRSAGRRCPRCNSAHLHRHGRANAPAGTSRREDGAVTEQRRGMKGRDEAAFRRACAAAPIPAR